MLKNPLGTIKDGKCRFQPGSLTSALSSSFDPTALEGIWLDIFDSVDIAEQVVCPAFKFEADKNNTKHINMEVAYGFSTAYR